MGVPTPDQMNRFLTLLALFGCARADGTLEQVEQLRGRPLALLHDGAPLTDVVHAVFDVMGDDWDPRNASGDWGPWISHLLVERRGGDA
jgi:hypothetical protein